MMELVITQEELEVKLSQAHAMGYSKAIHDTLATIERVQKDSHQVRAEYFAAAIQSKTIEIWVNLSIALLWAINTMFQPTAMSAAFTGLTAVIFALISLSSQRYRRKWQALRDGKEAP